MASENNDIEERRDQESSNITEDGGREIMNTRFEGLENQIAGFIKNVKLLLPKRNRKRKKEGRMHRKKEG